MLPKQHQEDANRLSQFARDGGLLMGLKLRQAQLRGVELNQKDSQKPGRDLRFSDLCRADLREAHLYRADLRHCNLIKADLRGANLNQTRLEGANLLGVRLDGARMEQMRLGRGLWQELQAQKQPAAERDDLYQQAEQVYRDLRRAAKSYGCYHLASQCAHRELTMARKQMPLLSGQRLFSKLVDLICGYGESPIRVVGFALVVMLLFALGYLWGGIIDNGEPRTLAQVDGPGSLLRLGASCLYFSIVTFTTLGFGDLVPMPGPSRLLAAIEALIGSFSLALLVVSFAKKMTR
ncbi:ion channel [Ferrimonas gelatinilytica]|uniref:Ion channel n=1 Tax=Ferrimonas gelatinilytica TaxID=1255257 RepID=A0ABP9SDN3_9GAMM